MPKQNLPISLMTLISLAQGLCLLYLHQAIDLGYWPQNSPAWLFGLYSITFIWPIMLLLSIKHDNSAAMLKYTLPFALLSGLLGYYVGNQAIPVKHITYDNLLFSYVFTMVIATFKALMYSQQRATGKRLSYSSLFLWSWRNFLTLALSLLFAGCLWLIFLLWGALFNAIGIHFFNDLFENPWFYYPAIALANGFGIIIFRRLTHIIDTITRLQQALMKFLLVLLVLISLLFLCALPFTGLEPLWKSGGSGLILWMQALLLFFVNAVYQDDPKQRPYPLWFHRFIYVGIAFLPLYSAISFYGLSLRIDQYGWSIDRCWAYLIWFLLALFALGYCWSIASKRDNWINQLSRINVAAGVVVLGAMLLINSPLLDFRKIVTNNQLQRLAKHTIKIETLDIHYFRYKLARPGYEGLQNIKAQYASSHPNMVVRINALYSNYKSTEPAFTQKELTAAMTVLAGEPPATLFEAIYALETKRFWQQKNIDQFYLRAVDLNEDGQTDYLLTVVMNHFAYLSLYYFEDQRWQKRNMTNGGSLKKEAIAPFISALRAGDIKTIRPEWNTLEINGKAFQASVTTSVAPQPSSQQRSPDTQQ